MFTDLDDADVLIVYEEKPRENMETIVIPSNSIDFVEWLKDKGLNVVRKPGTRTFVAATPHTILTMIPQTQYCYDGSIGQPQPIKLNDNILLLTFDIVKEYSKIVNDTLNSKSSTLYRLLTGLPISYTVAPEQLRNFLMSRNAQQTDLDFYDKLPLDALRFLLAKAIEEITDKRLERKTWNGKSYACAITHDIDTRNSLKRAKALKRLEERYDVPSAWYVPSKHCRSDSTAIQELGNYGEIGSHDIKHNGKLARLPKQRVVERLLEAKQTLEKIINWPIKGFRAPLLQHSLKIIQALEEVGYTYDTSIPTWEPKHPCTMKPHGIATAYPLTFNGITEIPVTLPQDHQLLYVLGLTPREVIEKWLNMIDVIKELGGLCIFLIHPDYKLTNSENFDVYEELIKTIASDNQAWITLPSKIVSGLLSECE